MPAELALSRLCKRYPGPNGPLSVLENFDLQVERGAFVAILGGNGYGKSTLLRTIAGVEEPTSGTILLDGEPVNQRLGRIGLVCQEVYLYPWRTTLENVAFGLEIRNVPRRRRESLALAYLRAFGLEDFARSYPGELSGGMRQKAAIARTLITAPDVMLMDEPFSALDYQTRAALQCFLLRLWAKRRETILFVTHDVEEAIFLSDYIVVLAPAPGGVVDTVPVNLPRPRPRGGQATEPIRKRVLEHYGAPLCPDNADAMRALGDIPEDIPPRGRTS